MPHRNSNKNMDPHHLYKIVDKVDEDVFKYGISCEPFGEDGSSDRIRTQVNYLNRIFEWARYFARILLQDIPGKKEARRIEKQHIMEYEAEHGRRPKGNPRY